MRPAEYSAWHDARAAAKTELSPIVGKRDSHLSYEERSLLFSFDPPVCAANPAWLNMKVEKR